MMKKISFYATAALASAGTLFVLSCNKTTVDSNTQTAQDYSMCQNEFLRLLPLFNSIASEKALVRGIEERVSSTPPFPKVTYDTLTWPRQVVVNYGSGGTDPLDGQFRSGIITGSYSDLWENLATTSLTLTFNGYSVNNVNYSGTATYFRNKSSNTQFTANISGICNVTGFPPILFNANGLAYTWLNGVYPPDTVAWQGSYSISGNGSGQDRNQVKYTFTTTSTLIKNNNCCNMDQGTVTITPAGLAIRTVNYLGGTNCNQQATVTIDGQNYTITSN